MFTPTRRIDAAGCTASAANAATRVTVAPTASDTNAEIAYLDDSDMALQF